MSELHLYYIKLVETGKLVIFGHTLPTNAQKRVTPVLSASRMFYNSCLCSKGFSWLPYSWWPPGPTQDPPRNPQHFNKCSLLQTRLMWQFPEGLFGGELPARCIPWLGQSMQRCIVCFSYLQEYVNVELMYTYLFKSTINYKIVKYKMITATYAVRFAGCVSTCSNRIVVPANWV